MNKFLDDIGLSYFWSKIKSFLDQKVNKSGSSMTGQLLTSYRNSVAIGSIMSAQNTIEDLIEEVRLSSGCMGSVQITTAYETIPIGWYNYIWIPHRTGGVNGTAGSSDNTNYGNLLLFGMTMTNNAWNINYKLGTISYFSLRNTNTTYSDATNTTAGLMSAADKIKLDGIAEGATTNSASTTTPKANGTASVGTEVNYARGDHIHPLQTTVSGNAGTATKLQTARTINGMTFDGTSNIIQYGSCTNSASTAAKTVTLSGFVLATGARILVNFSNQNTATNATLNVNSTGAKAIYYKGSPVLPYQINKGVYEFVYTGTYFELVSDIDGSIFINSSSTVTDLNNFTTPGKYYLSIDNEYENAPSDELLNYVVGNAILEVTVYGSLIVQMYYNFGYTTGIASGRKPPVICVRKIMSETAGPWARILDNTSLPIASSDTLGSIKVGSGLSVSSDGVLSTSNDSEGSINQTELLNLIYPIGRGFIDFTDTDYSNYLGFTWERELVGMFPVGYNPNDSTFSTIGNIGGEKTHTLTVSEMPSHTHTQNAHSHTTRFSNNKTLAAGRLYFDGNNCGNNNASNSIGNAVSYTTSNTTATNQNTGGGAAHNNLPPYQVVAYWKRVA